MTGLTAQQIGVERSQLSIRTVLGQQGHALMGSGFDQPRHQKRIQHSLGFTTTDVA